MKAYAENVYSIQGQVIDVNRNIETVRNNVRKYYK